MQPMTRLGNLDDPDPPDVFCSLGSLIVEGRVPQNNGRGFEEGPHVPHPSGNFSLGRHECSLQENTCKKDENFRKHMLLLWQNNVPVSIEVLLCSDCRVGRQKARSIEFSTIPEPGSILLEQWTVAIQNQRHGEQLITSKGLLQAVRSYLHFSQLSAWYSMTRGEEPKNVLYRITIPGEAFSSKFTCLPEEHFFPSAVVGRTSSVHVSVRAVPRSSEIPRVMCPHNQVSPTEDGEENKLAMAGALAWKEANISDTDLRRTIAKSKLAAECQPCTTSALPRSDSMDSMLGDSLLDPPQCLQKILPKRYQSPSRCGSPSLETPEHLLFGNPSSRDSTIYDSSRQSPTSSDSDTQSSRTARHDQLRRRDMNLYYGLHPRVLGPPPRLSLPPRPDPRPQGPLRPIMTPCRAIRPSTDSAQEPFDDRMQVKCTISGKHVCNLEDEDATVDRPDRELGAKRKSWSVRCQEQKMEETPELKSRRSSIDDIFDDGSRFEDKFNPSVQRVTQVYRAETSKEPMDKSEILLGAIIRTSEKNREAKASGDKVVDSLIKSFEMCKVENKMEDSNGAISNGHSTNGQCISNGASTKASNGASNGASVKASNGTSNGVITQQLTVTNGSSSNGSNGLRMRSLSENTFTRTPDDQVLEPLDLSFDGSFDMDETKDEEEDEDAHKENHVPTASEVQHFRKSFESSTKMVFHRQTGLPLTSSPAPIRKGKAKFDFDSTITGPHDIKRALFENDRVSTKRARASASRRILSQSAPATVTSSNLLGNFEESVLNGRLEPVSTVEGFTTEIGASGSFHPKHMNLPVTVFFYTLCDNSTISSPYLGHINLSKKGYRVPEKGTIQVTLFNPMGTVVKMFVVMYDLSDMPPNSQTFVRQRTLYMPSDLTEFDYEVNENWQKWLRYLIHLRFASSKSGKIYLHSDIRMIIFRKSDLDTATDHTMAGKGFELRSFTRGPTNPKFSPRR